MTIAIDVGKLARVTGTFTDDNAAAVDPTTVRLIVLTPEDVTLDYDYSDSPTDVVRSAAGVYYVDVPATVRGTYRYRWVSTGTGQSAERGQFQAHAPTPVAP